MFGVGVRTKLSPKARILGIAEMFLHTREREKKKNHQNKQTKKPSLYLWYRKELKENAPQRMAAKRRKKACTCTVFINIYDYVGLFLAHNSW